MPGTELRVWDAQELLSRCMENLDLVECVLEKYLDRFPADLEQLEQLVASEDSAQLAKTAHRLKGTAASMAAHRLAKVFGQIELAADGGDTEQLADSVSRIKAEWCSFLEEAMRLRRREPAPAPGPGGEPCEY